MSGASLRLPAAGLSTPGLSRERVRVAGVTRSAREAAHRKVCRVCTTPSRASAARRAPLCESCSQSRRASIRRHARHSKRPASGRSHVQGVAPVTAPTRNTAWNGCDARPPRPPPRARVRARRGENVGASGIEPETSAMSTLRSYQLSYAPPRPRRPGRDDTASDRRGRTRSACRGLPAGARSAQATGVPTPPAAWGARPDVGLWA